MTGLFIEGLLGIGKQSLNHHLGNIGERESNSKIEKEKERERFLMGAAGLGDGERVYRNPCLSCLEAIVPLSQTYQLSQQLDLIRTFHTFQS